jgi:hypothetical protein
MINKCKDNINFFDFEIGYQIQKQTERVYKIQSKRYKLFKVYKKEALILASWDIVHRDTQP